MSKERTPTMRLTKHTLVSEADRAMTIGPTRVSPDMTLLEVARTYTEQRANHVLCVVDAAGRLIGLIQVRRLFDDLLGSVVPEGLLADMTSGAKAADFTRMTAAVTAGEFMMAPVSVRPGDTVRDAYVKMRRHALEGIPIVDDGGLLVGYLDMAELLFAWVQGESEA